MVTITLVFSNEGRAQAFLENLKVPEHWTKYESGVEKIDLSTVCVRFDLEPRFRNTTISGLDGNTLHAISCACQRQDGRLCDIKFVGTERNALGKFPG